MSGSFLGFCGEMAMMRAEYQKPYGYGEYLIAVAVNDLGYRCGYVGVPKGDPLYGMSYDDEKIFDSIWVHCGLTFSGTRDFIEPDLWFFGFDCGHIGDAIDITTAEGKARFDREITGFRSWLLEGHVWTLEETIAESECLADQLIRLSQAMRGDTKDDR